MTARSARARVTDRIPPEPTATGITWERRRARLVLPTVLVVAALAASVLGFVSPIRQLLAQEGRIRDAEATVDELDAENERLQERIDQLNRDSVVEQVAREELGLVRPGEEAYVLVPLPATTAPAPAPPPAPEAGAVATPPGPAASTTTAAPAPATTAPAPADPDGYRPMGTPIGGSG